MDKMREKSMWNKPLLDLVYPRRCPICDSVLAYGETGVCKKHQTLPFVKAPYCMKCGKELEEEEEYCSDCQRHTRSFVRGYPVFNYAEPIKSSILAVKYHNKREYLDYYGAMLAKRIEPELSGLHLSGLVPVPIHKSKKRERGFNQAELLANVVGKTLGLPVYRELLFRMHDTIPQKELSPAERTNNIRQALQTGMVVPDCKNVLLVDDIYTTGATVQACTEALLEAGIQHVYVGVVCIGEGR